jgi:hypothetical protein
MDNSIREFLLLVKKLLVEVRTASFNLLRLQEKAEATSKQEQPKESANDQPFPPVVSVLTTPTAIKVQAETRERKDVWQRVFEVLELLGIAAVVAYALLSYSMWKEMIRSTNAAESAANSASIALVESQTAFKLDEQARIKITKVDAGWRTQEPRGPLTANVFYTNIGKTPAQVVGVDKHISVVGFNKQTQTTDDITFRPGKPIPSKSMIEVFLGDEDLFSVDKPHSVSEQKAVEAQKGLIVAWGCVEYRDIFGDFHWTDFCWVRQWPPYDTVYAHCRYQCSRDKGH